MAKKVPAVTPRRPAPIPEAKARELEAAAEHRQRAPAGASVRASERPDAQEDRRIVTRKGRILADGSRTAAPPRIRLTVYLEPDLGRRLDVYAASHGRERSGVLGEALAAWLAKHGG
jgi:hypothetical protein